jgi:hypothetical protein
MPMIRVVILGLAATELQKDFFLHWQAEVV